MYKNPYYSDLYNTLKLRSNLLDVSNAYVRTRLYTNNISPYSGSTVSISNNLNVIGNIDLSGDLSNTNTTTSGTSYVNNINPYSGETINLNGNVNISGNISILGLIDLGEINCTQITNSGTTFGNTYQSNGSSGISIIANGINDGMFKIVGNTTATMLNTSMRINGNNSEQGELAITTGTGNYVIDGSGSTISSGDFIIDHRQSSNKIHFALGTSGAAQVPIFTLDNTEPKARFNNQFRIYNTTNSTSISSGALIVDGGVGINNDVYIGGDINIAGDTTIGGNLTYNSITGDNIIADTVTIGSTTNTRPLTIRGIETPAGVSQFITLKGYDDSDYYHINDFADGLNISETNVADFRLFIQKGTGNISIGSSSSTHKLLVGGTLRATGTTTLANLNATATTTSSLSCTSFSNSGISTFTGACAVNGGISTALSVSGDLTCSTSKTDNFYFIPACQAYYPSGFISRKAENVYTVRNSASGTFYISFIISSRCRSTSSKGQKITGFKILYYVAAANLTSATVSGGLYTASNGGSIVVSGFTISGSMSTTTSVPMKYSSFTIDNPQWCNNVDDRAQIEFDISTTGTIEIVGVQVSYEENDL